jgi:HK97 family phage prohead protease
MSLIESELVPDALAAAALEQPASAAGELFSAIVPLTNVDVRDPSANPDNTWTMSGYAAVFNQQAIYLDSKWLRIILEIDPAAFDDVLSTQALMAPEGVVHFNLGHDMNRAVAATDVPAGEPGSLQLSVDAHGLRYLAKVSRDDPDGVALAVKMRDKVIKQASMAFVCGSDETTITENDEGPDIMLRRILTVKTLFDVCACPQGVFSQTISSLQQFAAAFPGQPGAVALGGHQRQPNSGGASTVSPPEVVAGGGAARRSEIAAMRRTLARLRS